MKIRWTHTAIGHLASIYEFIGCDSPRYAQRMIDRITSRSRQIARFPRSGQMVPEYQVPDTREVIEGSFRVIYEVDAEEVRVLAVIHGASQLPPEPPSEPGAEAGDTRIKLPSFLKLL
jgi:toxin ParE1/3/4